MLYIQEWFKEQFTDQNDEPLHSFTGVTRPLQSPIKEAEVDKALRALKMGVSLDLTASMLNF